MEGGVLYLGEVTPARRAKLHLAVERSYTLPCSAVTPARTAQLHLPVHRSYTCP